MNDLDRAEQRMLQGAARVLEVLSSIQPALRDPRRTLATVEAGATTQTNTLSEFIGVLNDLILLQRAEITRLRAELLAAKVDEFPPDQ